MNFSTSIDGYNADFNLNAVRDYNNFLKKQSSFDMDINNTDFSNTLEKVTKSVPLKDGNDPTGMGSLMDKMSFSFGSGLEAVNNAKLEADRLQEDLAMGGSTSIHEAMIAAQKAELSMNMAIQIRNRILNAYTEINNMAL